MQSCGRGSVVEHLLAKERVVGSNPIARSVFQGDVAKWKGSGLQNRDHGFKSRRRLWLEAGSEAAISLPLLGAVAKGQTLRT